MKGDQTTARTQGRSSGKQGCTGHVGRARNYEQMPITAFMSIVYPILEQRSQAVRIKFHHRTNIDLFMFHKRFNSRYATQRGTTTFMRSPLVSIVTGIVPGTSPSTS